MQKRIIAIILVICAVISCLSGCSSDNSDTPQTVTETTSVKQTDNSNFKLSYTQADSLDPFKAETQNNQVLASLVFESLFDIDESYEISNNIASGYSFTDSRTLKIDINTQLKFSDGKNITAADAAYSVRAAIKSDAYGSALDCISSAEENGNSVIIRLKYENPYVLNLLTFPISSMNDDENGFPIGSGRYKYESTENGKTILVANKETGFDPYITTITLVNIASSDSIDNAVNIGNISYAFRDLSEDTSKRFSCAKKAVDINNMIYIGINGSSGITSNSQIRRAISLAVDRSIIAESAYSGYASAAESMFNPNFKSIENIKLFSAQSDTATAKQTVAQSGYSGDNLKLSILVNFNDNRMAAANLIKTQLETAGFTVTVDKQNFSNYTDRIENGNFDIYIGEVKLGNDMSLYPFFDEDGGTSYGIDNENNECDDLYKSFLSGEEELGKFILSFNEEMPFIPLVYKKGMICYSKALNGDMQGYYGNFFSNIEDWNFGIDGGNNN